MSENKKKELLKKIKNKNWRINHLYKIKDKDKNVITFKRNSAQKHFNENKHTRNIILKSRQLGFCLDPETRVLTADLLWVKMKDLKEGMEIIAVDENTKGRGRGRKMRTAIIEKVVYVRRQAYKITFEDNRSLILTDQHPLLSKSLKETDLKWRSINKREGLQGTLKVGYSVRSITTPWGDTTAEDGWFGGMLDGEGSMPKNKSNSSMGLCVSQIKGAVWDRLLNYVKARGYNYRIENDDKNTIRKSKYGRKPVPKLCIGRMRELFRIVGQTRPTRFLERRFWEGRELGGKKISEGNLVKIVKIEKLGTRDLIDLQTSEKTYIAEGFVSHNTTDEAIDMLDDCLFKKNFEGLLIAQDLDTAKDIFSNKIEFAWKNFVFKDDYRMETDNRRQMKFNQGDDNYSSILVDNSGRSGTFSRLHTTELAKLSKNYPDRAKEVIEGTIPAMPRGSRVDIESTSEGASGLFYDMFWNAWNREREPKEKEFKAHFYNWTWDEEIENIIPEKDLPQEFLDYQKKFDLTDKEITFYYYQWLALNKNWHSLRKEYPTTPEEAFETSGNKLFDLEKIDEMETREGIKKGDWTFYKDFSIKGKYAMGVDVAEGVGRDYSACVIWDFSKDKAEVVAEFSNNKITPDLLAYEIKNGAERYGDCLVAVERNNHGHTTLSKLREIYPKQFIYKTKRDNDDNFKNTSNIKWGWETNKVSKPKMFFDFNDALNDDVLDIPSKIIKSEMKRYDREELDDVKFYDEETNHWDLLTASVIGFQMRSKSIRREAKQFIPNLSSPLQRNRPTNFFFDDDKVRKQPKQYIPNLSNPLRRNRG